MSEIRTALQVAFWSAKNSARGETRWRIAALVALALDLALAAANMGGLATRIAQWQAAGAAVVQSQLWLVCLAAWGGISLLALLGGLQLEFRSNVLRLLVTHPLSPASLFRLQYVWVVAGNANWLLLGLALIGVPLVLAMGMGAWTWIVLLVVGELLAAWGGFVLPLLFVRVVVPHRNGALVLLAVMAIGLTVVGRLSGLQPLAFSNQSVYPSVSPALGALMLLALSFLALGPLAGLWGRLQMSAFQVLESRRGQRTALQVPGIRMASGRLSHRRTLMGALFVKGLASQSRNPLFWARLIALIVYYAVFPFIRAYLIPYHIPDLLFVVAYSSGLAVLMVADSAPSPVGGEGNRLALYLIAPLKPMEVLRAKWITLLVPVILLGLALTLALALPLGLQVGEIAFACVTVSLIVVGSTALVVGASVWDADLSQKVEGAMQAFLQEEAPITPQRLLAITLGLVFLAIALGLLWKLSADIVLPVLFLLDGLVLVGAGYLARARWLQLGRA